MRRAIAEVSGHEVLFPESGQPENYVRAGPARPAHISVLINGLRARVSPPKVADDRRSGVATTPILQKMLRSGVTTPKQCKFFRFRGIKIETAGGFDNFSCQNRRPLSYFSKIPPLFPAKY